MKNKIIISILIQFIIASAVYSSESNCLNCHSDFEDENGASQMITKDIHWQKGLGCEGCHGGDPELDDMDEVREVKGYQGIPDTKDIPAFCASCHADATYMHEHNPSLPTDQLDKYKTSVHGIQLLKEGDTKVANCISCHTVHQINSAELPHSSTHPQNIPGTCGKCHDDADYMKEYGIDTNILSDYTVSVHGYALLEKGDLGAPACNDCHGNHGAAPPGVSSLAAVCGTCHAIEAELFNDSPHKQAFEENDIPMCETCHSNHKILHPKDEWIGSKEPSLCIECHSLDDGTIGLETADAIAATLEKLIHAHSEAETTLSEAKEKGMMTTEEEFLLKEVEQSLIQTRTRLHSFNKDSVEPKAVVGIEKANLVRTNSAALIDEFYFRRIGLGIATLFITLLCIGLYLKIRNSEKEKS